MLRQTPETSIGTSIVRKKTPKIFHPWKGRLERVSHSRTSKRQRNSIVSLRMCSVKMNTPMSAPFMNDIAVSKDRVIKLLKGLNPSKALGPDELHPRVRKELATELGPVFAHLQFQQSIDTGEIPKEWSLANICPLLKKSDRSLACNYRPVSLTCVPCKLLEHIVCSNIMAHLDEYKLLSDRQHAFRKGHCCETQLTTLINRRLSAIVFYVHFWQKMSIIYRWNQHQMFYLQSSLDVAYHISVRIYKLFNLASLPKNDFTLVLYCSMSILNQWNASIKKGLVMWLLRSHEHILLCHWFSTTIHQLSEDEETDSGEKQSTSIYIIKESSSHPRWVYLDNVCIFELDLENAALLVMESRSQNCSISGLLKKRLIF